MRKFIAILTVVTAAFIAMPAGASPLEKEMKALGKITKNLKKADGDFEKAAALAKEANAQVQKCAGLTPSMVEKTKDETAKNMALDDYRKRMEGLTKAFGEVESACQAKDKDKLTKAIESVDALKEDSHKKFEVK